MDAGGFSYGKDDDGYMPTNDDLVTYSEIEERRAMLPSSSPNKIPIVKKKKPKMKQMKMEKGLKNMMQKNFQGFPMERCTIVEGGLCIYMPKKYGGNTRKKYRNRQLPAVLSKCCHHCFLVPCSMYEYNKELENVLDGINEDKLASYSKEELVDKVRSKYRTLINKNVGKTYLIRCMPKNDAIPVCAKEGTMKLVEEILGENDSIEDSPMTHDRKLNERDNKQEDNERMLALRARGQGYDRSCNYADDASDE